ncbi:MAG TPA: DUF5695 domain-containing protein [Terracidiphilus sp.]|nr:DUF5695 domain-containing protein [Terracidiphilus sp.]
MAGTMQQGMLDGRGGGRARCDFFVFVLTLALVGTPSAAYGQQNRPNRAPTPGPMLGAGTETLETPQFTLKLVRSSQTVAALLPKGAGGFDFTPGDRLTARSHNGYYHLGDIDLRLRTGSAGPWENVSTALDRHPVLALPAYGDNLAVADLTPTLPADSPLHIVRAWALDHGQLILRFTLTDRSSQPVEIGSLGIPMIFNNILTDRTLAEAHATCSFYDPYIGEDAGYLQVTRLSGHGPVLLVVPDGHTPFEAYNPILSERPGTREMAHDPTPRGITFEGFYEWMVHSAAYQENEWKKARPWNLPTSATLRPGQSRVYALRFLRANSVRTINKTLAANHHPVAVGVPGYVLPQDMVGHLFLDYSAPVASMKEDPAGAIAIRKTHATPGGWRDYIVRGKTWGRVRLTITYRDGMRQTVSYRVIKPEADAVADLGHFLTTQQWFTDAHDPFHRAPSAITYDDEPGRQVTQEGRVWIAGLSDEAGAGSWLALAMKEFVEPDQQEVDKLEKFVDGVLWGGIQYKDGPEKYGVRKSLFYYQPEAFPLGFYSSSENWKTWASWNKKQSEAVDRSFNYPHVASAYWVLYRLARNHPGLVTDHSWQWYLEHAYETSMAMVRFAPYYAQFGQMEGDIFLDILADLQREGMNTQAEQLKAVMRARAEHWRQEEYPFASEMPWDSTGQEEVYAWTRYFGFENKAQTTLSAILGYDPTVPSWGYNGSARRYWDFLYAGKVRRLERQLHHYGSGINAIPLLAAYRSHPDDLYLLRVGYGGTMGELTDINQSGFASAAFHGFPDMLAPDPYSGDYGPGFWGFAMNTATYVVHDPTLGWLCFGGNLRRQEGRIRIQPLDAAQMRLYIAPAGLWITLDAGRIREAVYNPSTGVVSLSLDSAKEETPVARLRIAQPARIPGVGHYKPSGSLQTERGAWLVPLGSGSTVVVLRAGRTKRD